MSIIDAITHNPERTMKQANKTLLENVGEYIKKHGHGDDADLAVEKLAESVPELIEESTNKQVEESGIRYSFKMNPDVRYSFVDPDNEETTDIETTILYEKMMEERKRRNPLAQSGDKWLRNYLDSMGNDKTSIVTFQDVLLYHINKSHRSNSDIYKKANMSRSLFSSIISNKGGIPKKENVMALCISLELNMRESLKLLEKAGYTLSNSIVTDLVVKYFIQNKKYDIDELNGVLHELGQPLLGSKNA